MSDDIRFSKGSKFDLVREFPIIVTIPDSIGETPESQKFLSFCGFCRLSTIITKMKPTNRDSMNLLLITIPQTKLINQNKRQRNRDSATIKRYTLRIQQQELYLLQRTYRKKRHLWAVVKHILIDRYLWSSIEPNKMYKKTKTKTAS